MSETPPKVTCPKCGSDQIHANRKTPSSELIITCLSCANEFRPGEKKEDAVLNKKDEKTGTTGCIVIVIVLGLSYALYNYLNTPSSEESTSSTTEKSTTTPVESSNSTTTYPSNLPSDPYEVIHTAFEGFPDIDKVKPMLEAVMKYNNVPINNDRILKSANVLVGLKNDSKVGVTEMEILKDMYQNRRDKDYVTSAAMSAVFLETTK